MFNFTHLLSNSDSFLNKIDEEYPRQMTLLLFGAQILL